MWIVRETDSAANNLSEEEAENNCKEVDNFLRGSEGWSANSVAAVCGNMWVESHRNPGCWQYGYFENWKYGYGLGQWTPATKLKEWAEARNLPFRGNGNTQLKMLNEESGQWHTSSYPYPPGSSPPITWEDFKHSELPVQTLTEYFLYYWEDPHSAAEPSRLIRIEHAEKYYKIITGREPEPPGTTPGRKKGLPWMYWLPPQTFIKNERR